jgi:8-oxo-dGTP diphosphatase
MMSGKPLRLSVKMIVRDESGRCLLLKRSMSSKGNPGKWDFPGGKIDPGEAFNDALIREVAEETGLAVSILGVAGTAESELSTSKVVYLILEGRLESGQVRLSNEHDDSLWVDPQELPTVDLADQFRPFAKVYSQACAREQAETQAMTPDDRILTD